MVKLSPRLQRNTVLLLVLITASFIFSTFSKNNVQTGKIEEQKVEQKQESPKASETQKPKVEISSEITVSKVIDGDTIELENGQKLRYIGIDTPETVDPRRPVGCFGLEASAKNKELVEGKKVRLEKDVSETDKYGRLLRYVYLGDTFINEYLVKEGFAKTSSYPPDVKYQDKFRQAENYARENNKGLWLSCNSVQGTQTSPSYRLDDLTQ